MEVSTSEQQAHEVEVELIFPGRAGNSTFGAFVLFFWRLNDQNHDRRVKRLGKVRGYACKSRM